MSNYPTQPEKILSNLQLQRSKIISIRHHLANLFKKQGRLEREIKLLQQALEKHTELLKEFRVQQESFLKNNLSTLLESEDSTERKNFLKVYKEISYLFDDAILEYRQALVESKLFQERME